MAMRIVFVCTTNVWGSAMAELISRQLLTNWGIDHDEIQLQSAGIRPEVGSPMPWFAQQEMARLGIDATKHRARWMTPDLLSGADLTLTTGPIQRDAALQLNPTGLRTTFAVLEAVRLLGSRSRERPLVPDLHSHARVVIAQLAENRRFRLAPEAVDGISDAVGNSSDAHAAVNCLIPLLTQLLSALTLPHAAARSDAQGGTAGPLLPALDRIVNSQVKTPV